ncbi:uncharacterized protein [Rutidosis leptorrhynchoides]|uniref:uncharacterized protein n=1 Tax=Rutidosis leptorrhynchoides TaxID=125765 RepID=UPI003A996946
MLGSFVLTKPAVQILRAIVENFEAKKTTLTEWLNYNASSANGSHLTYLDFSTEFVWYESKKGCKSFADIRTVNQIVHDTYRSACEASGLLGDDREWSAVLEEASVSATSSQLRCLFAHILSYCTVTNPLALWENHWKLMGDDIPLRAAANLNMSDLHINADDLHNFVLYEVEILLNQCSKLISDFPLPSLPADLLADLANRLIMEERNYDRTVLNIERLELERQMNSKQNQIYDRITTASLNEQTEHVFVYGHGGTGKTFSWKAIITALRSRGKIVLAVASSGIASLLLPSGRTAHSRFKLPLVITDESMCNIKKNTHMTILLQNTDLIVWDEVPMNDKRCFEALDRSLQDILGNTEEFFGGKSVILGGDFKQMLPIQTKGGKSAILGACITTSHLWQRFKVFILAENMRLLRPGLTPSMRFCIPDDENGLANLISFIYPRESLQNPSAVDLHQKAIVCPKNDAADTINSLIVDMVDGPVTTYCSYDTATPHGNDGGEAELLYPAEYLNTLNYPGLPPHELHLKKGVPAILLRNINIAGGLCNGTRMIIT